MALGKFACYKIRETRFLARYLYTSMLVSLSKSRDQFLTIDKIRTIAVMLEMSKLLEICTAARLELYC